MVDFEQQHEIYRLNVIPEMVETLAQRLGVSSKALYALDIGYNAETNAWIFPERDATSKIIGLLQRFWDGKKTCIKDSKRGLAFIPVAVEEGYDSSRQKWLRVDERNPCPICQKPDWCCIDGNSSKPRFVLCMRNAQGAVHQCKSGGYIHELVPGSFIPPKKFRFPLEYTELPVLVVEGHSDVAAAYDLGFVAVGRPSAEGGLSLLHELLQGRHVVIIGENDSGAGKKGMEQTFEVLKSATTSAIKILPPDGIKDLRQWIQQGLTKNQLLSFIKTQGNQANDGIVLASIAPLDLARTWLNAQFRQGEIYTLKQLHGNWYRFTGQYYEEIDKNLLRKSLYEFFGGRKYKKTTTDGFTIADYDLTKYGVDQILDAAITFCMISVSSIPCWLDKPEQRPNPKHILVFPNGYLDINAYLQGNLQLLPITPEFFTLACYPYAFNPTAKCPQWQNFLNEIFYDDSAKQLLLQEWFGYNLVPDNSYEKFMMLLGPPRAGKGTILEILAYILGEKQVIATTFRDYTRRFGFYPFIGKLAALIGDVSVGTNYDATEALNILKRITGNDSVSIEQKGRDITQTCIKLHTRFTMAANTMPRLPDFVRAIESRILIIQFLLTFAGREDYTLKDRLKEEIAGILIWSLDGLKRLRESGLFTLPANHNSLLRRIRSELTPFAEFVDECCELGRGEKYYVPQERLYECWKIWAAKNGENAHSVRWMIKVLLSLYPTCRLTRRMVGEQRLKVFAGIKLQSFYESEFEPL